MLGMDDGDGLDVRQQFVVDLKCICRHFQHHGIVAREVFGNPRRQLRVPDPPWTEHGLLVSVHRDGDEIVLMDIQTDEPRGMGWDHGHSLASGWPIGPTRPGASGWAHGFTHRFEFAQQTPLR